MVSTKLKKTTEETGRISTLGDYPDDHTWVSVMREQRAKSQASEGNFLVLTREAISSRTEKVIGSWQDSVTLHWPGEQGE